MKIPKEKFKKLVEEALDNLPEKFKGKLYNVAIFIKDCPDNKQLKKLKIRRGETLLGLFEGYAQAKRINFGPVLPDRITIFRRSISEYCSNEREIKEKITNTVKHEIAHYFGSNEYGARKAARRS